MPLGKGLKELSGMSKPHFSPPVDDAKAFCDNLNSFNARFDTHNFSSTREDIVSKNNFERIIICEKEVVRALRSIKLNKAPCPHGIGSNLLKMCSVPLAPVLCKIYQQSLDQVSIPKIWKTLEIIQIPKRTLPTCDNDYRPVALTAIMMNCLEKIIRHYLQSVHLQTHISSLTLKTDVWMMPPCRSPTMC